jgi:predicted glycoside hydrolase/deacetylase ChbG (UPF0249 family)
MKYLIITADDFGLTESVNEGIAKACTEGIVTAVSVIPTGEAFEDALTIIKNIPFKDIGAHLALSETKPILSGSRFYKNHSEFFFHLFFGTVNLADSYEELKAQLEILKKTGLKITHINSHEHIHIMPRILEIFIRLAREYSIPAIRFPRTDRPPKILSVKENYKSFLLNYFYGRIKNSMNSSGLAYTDFFMGLLDAGKLDINKIKTMARYLKDGVTEIVTHPGFLSPEVLKRYPWHMGGETELFALTDNRVKNAIKDNGIKLVSYEQFLALKQK